MARPSPRAFFTNWRTYEASLATRLRLSAKNQAIKVRTRSNCCGNHGEPGC